jgi:hypothetical protein
MSQPTQPTKRKIGLDDIEDLDVAARDDARKHGVPTAVPAGRDGEGRAPSAVTPLRVPRSPSRRIHIETPLYVSRELKDKAAAEDTTMTYIVKTYKTPAAFFFSL